MLSESTSNDLALLRIEREELTPKQFIARMVEMRMDTIPGR
jgi:hypothetical protein